MGTTPIAQSDTCTPTPIAVSHTCRQHSIRHLHTYTYSTVSHTCRPTGPSISSQWWELQSLLPGQVGSTVSDGTTVCCQDRPASSQWWELQSLLPGQAGSISLWLELQSLLPGQASSITQWLELQSLLPGQASSTVSDWNYKVCCQDRPAAQSVIGTTKFVARTGQQHSESVTGP